MATSKAQPLLSSLRRPALDPFWLLPNSRCQKSPISLMGLSRSFVSFAVIVNWISGENILNYLRAWFTRMFELKSLPTYMRFRSFMGRIWWPLSLTISRLGSILISNLGNRCLDIKTLRYRVTDVLIFRNYEGFTDIQNINQVPGFANPPFDFFGYKKGEPYLIEFKGSLNHFHSPGETQKRRIQELLKKINGLHVALLQIRLEKGEYRIFFNKEMDLFFDGPQMPLDPVEKWIRQQLMK